MEKIKICKNCGVTSENPNIKFNSCKQCIKCKAKKNNEKLKAKEYYKNYWLNVTKDPNAKPRGRPKKEKNDLIL